MAARGKVKTVKRNEPTEEQLAEMAVQAQLEVIGDLTKARDVARLVFGENVGSNELFGCYDRMDLTAANVEDAALKILLAQKTATELFPGTTPGHAEIFDVFDRVFDVEEFDEDDDSEE